MTWLMIENKCQHIPSVEYLCTMGTSSSRELVKKIGQFGSGFGNSLALLAREYAKNHKMMLDECWKLCLGRRVFTAILKPVQVTNDRGELETIYKISLKEQNGKTYPLNLDIKFGWADWTDITMAVREFISNACDGAESYDGTYKSVVVEKSDNDRAKDGCIRVYMKLVPEIEDYVTNLYDYFICLKPNYDENLRVWSNADNGPTHVYRKGVLVGKFGKHSLFNYNIPDIRLRESRIVDTANAESSARHAILNSSNKSVIEKYMKRKMTKIGDQNRFFEDDIDIHSWDFEYDSRRKQVWKESLKSVCAGSIICSNSIQNRIVEAKGRQSLLVDSHIADILKIIECGEHAEDVINHNELAGREIIPTTENVQQTTDKVWKWMQEDNLTLSKEKPEVKCFVQHGSIETMGGYHKFGENIIYIRDIIMEDKGFLLVKVIIEELGHYITGATDLTREFQDFAFKVAGILFVELELLKNQKEGII